nr:uncharacterized protein LOC123775188 isoform X1 [Procambarus clarkii]XP_045626101.1 uncharacterized protein LOC123775188 isoform X1 [Procambarus clarkii]XP_045626102.1 uncharacterized protein LOC123775188 isoform X1 [Procambarus clarkii]
MSGGKGTRLARKRKVDAELQSTSGSSLHDITDDFEDSAKVFRLPSQAHKKPKTEQACVPARSRGRPRKIGSRSAAHSDGPACKETERPEVLDVDSDAFVEHQESQLLDFQEEMTEDNNFILELEKSICSESEKLCPCCKHIVPCTVFSDHSKECLQRFKLNKRESERKSINIAGQKPQEKTNGESASEINQQLLPCPVCLKSQKSKVQHQSHIKSCAQSHGLTMEQLLLASKLTEKQAEERIQLGLPLLVQQTSSSSDRYTEKRSKVSIVKRNNKESVKISHKDHDLAMALALSRSAAEEEAEMRSSREEKLLAMGLEQIVDEDRKMQPLIFPFPETGNQRAIASQTRNRGRKRQGNFSKTLLATRSVEERERLISEKVASILTSEDTPRVSWQNEGNSGAKGHLSKFRNEACKLWKTAHKCADQPLEDFYVPELEPYIKPQSIAVGGLLRRLSQIPGRLNLTSLQSISDENSDSGSDCGETCVVDGYCTQLALAELLGSQDCLNLTRDSLFLKEDAVAPQTLESLPDPNVTLEPASGFWVVRTTESLGSGETALKCNEDSSQISSENHEDNHYCNFAVGSITSGDGGKTTEKLVLDRNNDNISETSDKSSESNDESSPVKAAQLRCLVTKNVTSVGRKTERKLRNSSERTTVYKEDTKCDELNHLSTDGIDGGLVDNVSVDNNCREDHFESDAGHCEKTLQFKNNQHISTCNPDCEVIAVLNNSSEHTVIAPVESHPATCSKLPSACSGSEVQYSCSLQQAVTNREETLVLSTLDENSKFSESSGGSEATRIFLEDDYQNSFCNSSQKLLNVETFAVTDDSEGRETNKCYALRERINGDGVKDVDSTREEIPDESEKSRCLQEKFIYDWSNFFSNEKKSDVTVTVLDGSVILAHSLVFFVRCSLLYNEVIDGGMDILWDEATYEGATRFLVYIYTGTCNIERKSDPLWVEVYELALKYKCEELVSYLKSLDITDITSVNAKSSIQTSRICERVSAASDSDSYILKPPIRSSLQETNEQSGRRVRQNLNLYSFDTHTVLPKSPKSSISQADSDKLKEFSENSTSVSEGIQIMESQSPDIFDEPVLAKDVSFISTPSNSPPASVSVDKSPLYDGTHAIHSEPVLISKKTCRNADSSQNFGSTVHVTESNVTNLVGDQALVYTPIYEKVKTAYNVNPTEQKRASSVCGQASCPSSGKNNMDCEGSSTLLKVSDENKLTDCPDAGDDLIDLTLTSCENSPASCTNNDMPSLPGDKNNALDLDLLEEMEPLKLWGDSDSPETDEDACQEEPARAFNHDGSGAGNLPENNRLGQEKEDVNETYINNVWEDFDDVENDMSVPVDVCQTPVKNTLRSDSSADPVHVVLPVSRPYPSKKRKRLSISTESDTETISQCEPMASGLLYKSSGKEATARKYSGRVHSVSITKNIDTVSDATTKSKEANAMALNLSISDETMLKISDLDCEEVESVKGCKRLSAKLNESENFHVPLADLMTPQPKQTSKKQIVTPFPDYKNMSSPDLKKELAKYGLRALARRKAVVLLDHVYEQTHPLVTDSEAESSFCETPKGKTFAIDNSNIKATTTEHENVKKNKHLANAAKGKEVTKKIPAKRKKEKVLSASDVEVSDEEESSQCNSSQMSGTSCSTDDSKYDCIEESELFGISDDDITPTQQADIGSKVVQFISSDHELHSKVLLYEPIFVEELQASLKANGIKCSVKNLLDVLDDQCITFRTQNQRNQRRKQKKQGEKQRRSNKRRKRHSSASH